MHVVIWLALIIVGLTGDCVADLCSMFLSLICAAIAFIMMSVGACVLLTLCIVFAAIGVTRADEPAGLRNFSTQLAWATGENATDVYVGCVESLDTQRAFAIAALVVAIVFCLCGSVFFIHTRKSASAT